MLEFETIRIIRLQAWDALVEKTYGKKYSLQQQGGGMERQIKYFSVPCEVAEPLPLEIPEGINGSEMGVAFESWLSKDSSTYPENMDKSQRGLFWARRFYPDFAIIVNDFHARGLIERGEYGLYINW
jgi:hypothetical protein